MAAGSKAGLHWNVQSVSYLPRTLVCIKYLVEITVIFKICVVSKILSKIVAYLQPSSTQPQQFLVHFCNLLPSVYCRFEHIYYLLSFFRVAKNFPKSDICLLNSNSTEIIIKFLMYGKY